MSPPEYEPCPACGRPQADERNDPDPHRLCYRRYCPHDPSARDECEAVARGESLPERVEEVDEDGIPYL